LWSKIGDERRWHLIPNAVDILEKGDARQHECYICLESLRGQSACRFKINRTSRLTVNATNFSQGDKKSLA
jgi:hypothetical protein